MPNSRVFSKDRFYLRTEELLNLGGFDNAVPAFNNVYDVYINFNTQGGNPNLMQFLKQHVLIPANNVMNEPGDNLALFCSEAVLPGSSLQTAAVNGLRQGVTQNYAVYRRYPDFNLTFYSQKDYFTQEIFNGWLEYISPTQIEDRDHGSIARQRSRDNAFKKLKYPRSYKCEMEITAFSSDFLMPESRQNKQSEVDKRTPNYITYYMKNCFPSNIIAAPLAYGNAELVKTTVSFKYDYYTIDRGARIDDITLTQYRESLDDGDRTLREKAKKLISPFMLAI